MTPQGESGGIEAAQLAVGAPSTRGGPVRPPAAKVQPRRPWAIALSALVPGLGSAAIGRFTDASSMLLSSFLRLYGAISPVRVTTCSGRSASRSSFAAAASSTSPIRMR